MKNKHPSRDRAIMYNNTSVETTEKFSTKILVFLDELSDDA